MSIVISGDSPNLTSANLTTPIVTTTMGVGGATPAASGSGITFPATQSASTDANTLDDYEEGTWTPAYMAMTGTLGSISYSAQGGYYTKIGNMCYLQGRLRTNTVSVGSGSGDILISGLPFTSASSSVEGRNAGSLFAVSGWNTNNITAINVESGQTYMQINYRTSANGAMSQSQVSDLTTGSIGNQLFFSIAYRVA